MLSAAMEDALNSQLNAELYSSYLYLSMCAKQQANKINGIANWLGVQAKEELGHAVRFLDYINQAGGAGYSFAKSMGRRSNGLRY